LSDQEKDLPAVPSNIDTGLKRTLDAMREALQRMMGKRGEGGRAAVLWDDLAQGGIADKRGNLTLSDFVAKAIEDSGGAGTGAGSGTPDLTKPPTPTGLVVTPGFSNVFIEWDAPAYTVGHGHKQTNIYATKQAANDAALHTINDAVRIDIAPGALNILALPADLGTKWRVWIKFESADGVESDPAGGVNGAVATVVRDGAVTNAMLANAVIDDAKVANLSAAKLTAGNGTIGGILKSTNYTSGTLGWTVRPDGYAEFNNVVVRGTVYANTGEFSATVRMGAASSFSSGAGLWQGLNGSSYVWRVGSPGGNRAQWDGTALQVYTNNSSTPLLSAGGISASTGQLVVNTTKFTLDSSGNATFAGSLNAATGTFAGQLAAGTVDPSVFDAIVLPAYTTAGSFTTTVPAMKSGWTSIGVRVTLQAPGGGGGGGYASAAPNRNPTSSGGGGGAGGGMVFQWEGLTPGQTININLGQPGAPGSASTAEFTNAGWGGAGGNASVSIPALGLSQTANGGAGGEGGSMARADSGAPTNGGSIGGGQGASGIGGYTNIDGYQVFDGPAFNGGSGGSSLKGSGGSGGGFQYYPLSAGGGANGGTGAGGGGGAANASDPDSAAAGWGGWGGNGYILLEFYDPYSVVTNKRYALLINWLDTRGFGSVPAGAR
jgi:hypothetical protein